ncbi:Glycoprotein membrane precursor GPI-anchored [Rhynchospora pubera]|uniref:Glycoprotein membrane GPI-anchored n=1 Tax=Rhynchospora pubera TaxID=906938 RepID=A0AAV8DXT5_9POAL|nr:Glycoprotein membrane precursor GPI-anchored [Rhynchospora pubera]
MGFRLFLFSLSLIVCLLSQTARSDNTGSQLLKGINSYRASLNLTALSENSDACLAEQYAIQMKDEPCTDSTGDDTVAQSPSDASFLSRCHNATTTLDEVVMLACVPGFVSDLVLTNFTKSQYNQYLN